MKVAKLLNLPEEFSENYYCFRINISFHNDLQNSGVMKGESLLRQPAVTNDAADSHYH